MLIKAKIDHSRWSDDEIKMACDVVIGIADACAAGQYVKGNRNDMAVDFTIACHVLGIDPLETASMMDLNGTARANIRERISVCTDYVGNWETISHSTKIGCIWDYGLREHEWLKFYHNTKVNYFTIEEL